MKLITLLIKQGFKYYLLLPLVAVLFLSSCGDDNDVEGEPQFKLENDIVSISVAKEGKTEKHVIRSNRNWKFEPVGEGDHSWVKIFPSEGSEDGIVSFIVKESEVFTSRTATFEIRLDGKPHTTLFTVTQEAAVPRFSFTNVNGGKVEASKDGEAVSIEMDTNLKWNYTIEPNVPGESTDWLVYDVKNSAAKKLVLNIAALPAEKRSRQAIIYITTPSHPEFNTSFVVFQENIPPLEGLPVSWVLKGWGTTDERALQWLNNQRIYSTETANAFVQWTKGSNAGVGDEPTTYDISGGNPRVTRGREGDSWVFTIPIKNGRPNQGVKAKGSIRSSGAGVAWYYLEFSTDGINWTTVSPTTYTLKDGVVVNHTDGIRCQDGSLNWPFESIFVIPEEIADGYYYIRLRVTTDVTQNGTASPSSGGSARIVDDFSFEKM